MARVLGHGIGDFTIVHSGTAINVRLYQSDKDELYDLAGPMVAEYAWADQDESGAYVDTDDPGTVKFEHDDAQKAICEMAMLAMHEIVDSMQSDGAEF